VLAVQSATSPMFTFTGYWRADTPQLTDEWYVTGDTMSQDADGHFLAFAHFDATSSDFWSKQSERVFGFITACLAFIFGKSSSKQ
jgi:hypothetical protein